MKRTFNIQVGLATLLSAGILALGAVGAQAQPPGGGGGGFQMTPEMQARFKALQKYFQEDHKKAGRVGQMVRQIEEMEKQAPELKLNKDQSSKMLAVLTTWRNKKTMSEDEAGEVSKKITSFLNDKQLQKMTTFKMDFGRGGGRPGGGPGGPGGGPGARPGGGGPPGGGGRPGAPGGPGSFQVPDLSKSPGYNPLNPDTFPFERARPQMKKSLDDFTASLQKRAKG